MRIKAIIKALAVVGVLIALLAPVSGYSGAKTECTVKSAKDNIDVNNSLRRAVHWFNKNGELQTCRDKIDFNIDDAIPLRKPLVISGPNTSSTGEFVFGPASGMVTLSISAETFDGEDDTTCAVRISTPGARIRNIRISGNNAKSSGICIEGSVILENVEISQFVGNGVTIGSPEGVPVTGVALDKVSIKAVSGSAIMISEGVGQVAILPSVTINGVSQGVMFANGGAMSSSKIIGTNRKEGEPAVLDSGLANFLSADYYTSNDMLNDALGFALASNDVPAVEEDVPATDEEHGTIIEETPEAATAEQNFIFSGITGEVKKGIAFVDSNANVAVQVWKVQKGTVKGTFIIKGAVVEADPHAIPDQKNDEGFCGAPNAKDLNRLHVYAVKGGTARFITYVMEETQNDAGKWTYGIKTSSSSLGEFQFELDTAKFDATSIIIVPEFKSSPMGAASELIPLIQTKDFHCPAKAAMGGGIAGSDGSTWSSGGGTGGTGSYGDDISQYPTIQQCLSDSVGYTGNVTLPDGELDTDGDGIQDVVEMSLLLSVYQANPEKPIAELMGSEYPCDCSKTVTCWYKKDTDGDGVPDNAELKDKDGATIRDSDKDKIPDVRETDSDGDTLIDGVEDRFRTFKSSGTAFLYDDASTMNQNMPFTPFGAAVTCDLNIWKSVNPNLIVPGLTNEVVGISYGLYIVQNGQVQLYSLGMERQEGSYVKRLQCRDPLAFGETSFNGVYDSGYDRSDLTKFNSDLTIDFSSCQPGEILMGIPLEWYDGATNKLKDTDKNSVPDLFEQKNTDGSWNWQIVQSACSDVDSDGIPDCVKRWDGQCPNMTIAQKVMNPYKDDFDEDGVLDKVDVCPFTPDTQNGQDVYAKDKPIGSYSCPDPRKVFVDYPVKIITCFVDRDGDGLRDCQEDKDANGDLGGILEGKDGVAINETDPLVDDTDVDGLNDYDEIISSLTNPRIADSDSDGLSDSEEIKHGSNKKLFEKTTLAQEGCLAPLGKAQLADTDPWDPDTDLDKIMDGVEVNVVHTNPNNKDSDKDTILDGVEDENQNGIWPEFEGGKVKNLNNGGVDFVKDFRNTNPCLSDTDGDGFDDNDPSEDYQCAVTPTRDCKGDPNSGGMDSDADGLDDYHEAIMKTDPYNKDTDGDHVLDGAEIWYQIANNEYAETFQPQYGESDPNKCLLDEAEADMYATAVVGGVKVLFNVTLVGSQAGGTNNLCKLQVGKGCGTDSDGDCMPDNAEYTYGTNPGNIDSDGDGVIDGVEAGWCVAEVVDLTNGIYRLRPNTGQYTYQQGSGFSNAMNSDTDGDLLADGQGAGDLYYEDKNCNGRVDFSLTGVPLETDKLNANTDGDKWNDKAEFCKNGICGSQQNLAAAFTPMGPGCAVVAKGGETWGMTLMFVMMLGATRVAVYVMRRTKKVKARG